MNQQKILNEALVFFSKLGKYKVVKGLIDHGADVNAQNREALHCARENGHNRVVELLLRYMN